MSWVALKNCLQSMPESGEGGFEGLIAHLLELFLKTPFVVARSGEQPSGDARSYAGSTSIQAKRYQDNTPLSKTSIEGDIRRTIRSLPYLDVYVLAASREATQLRDTFDAIESETGLDIVLLTLTDELSELGALCAAHWQDIREFDVFSSLGGEFDAWIRNEAKSQSAKKILKQLKQRLRLGVQTQSRVQKDAYEYLLKRLSNKPTHEFRFTYEINLQRAIKRTAEKDVLNWWQNSARPICYIEAEEGYGKSWLAAKCVKEIGQGESIVFWLDSHQWTNCQSLSEVVQTCLGLLYGQELQKIEKLKRKVFRVWDSQTLVVLDGVNERNAIRAAKKILDDYFLNKHSSANTLRILLTTRPLELYPEYEVRLWKECHRISLDQFDDFELNQAMVSLGGGQMISDLPHSLDSIVRIPRYFGTCIRLKEKFHSAENVTKEMVLWADLIDRIDKTDPQVREKLGWRKAEDAEAILSHLAKNVKWQEESAAILSGQLLKDCFGDYSRVRHDLQDLRIAQTGPNQAQLSSDHVTLGWALYIHSVLNNFADPSIETLSEQIHRELEPIPSEDNRTEALFVALQLSALSEQLLSEKLTNKRSALLLSWLRAHNPMIKKERLSFWAGEDTDAYCRVVEILFERFDSSTETFIIEPLAHIWKSKRSGFERLREYLRKWLLLTWSPDDKYESLVHYQGFELPVAKSSDQLRLSAVAISIISHRCDPELLESLAVCFATMKRSTEEIDDRKRPLKFLHDNIGLLMRWGYTEQIIPELTTLAIEKSDREVTLEGIRGLNSLFVDSDPPEILRMHNSVHEERYYWKPPVEIIRSRGQLLTDVTSESFSKRPLTDIGCLAIRVDLPGLNAADIQQLNNIFDGIETQRKRNRVASTTIDDRNLESLLPWLAKYRSKRFADFMSDYIIEALALEDDPWFSLCFVRDGIVSKAKNYDVADAIIAARKRLVNLNHADVVAELLTEVMLFCGSVKQLKQWFSFLGDNQDLRKAIRFLPAPRLISLLLPRSLTEYAHKKLASDKLSLPVGDEPISQVEYWSYLYVLGLNDYSTAKKSLDKHLEDPNIDSNRLEAILQVILKDKTTCYDLDGSENEHIRKRMTSDKYRNYVANLIRHKSQIKTRKSYEELMSELSPDTVGQILLQHNRMEDLDRWGGDLLDIVYSLFEGPQVSPSHRGFTRFVVDDRGYVKAIDYDRPQKEDVFLGQSASFWGVKYGTIDDVDQFLNEDPTHRKDDFQTWKKDLKHLESWSGYLIRDFNAIEPLQAWANRHGVEFTDRAITYLRKLESLSHHHYLLGRITEAILCLLLPFEPQVAYSYYSKISGRTRSLYATYYRVPFFIAQLWNISLCKSDEHEILRRKLLEDCENDEEIMHICLAALAEGGDKTLWTLAVEEYLQSNLAKYRNLAVSIIMWFASDEAIRLLNQIRSDDRSYWVQEHANWAYEVAQQELSCRQVYRRALQHDNLTKISTCLYQIKPVLLPTAGWWRHQIEAEVDFRKNCTNMKLVACVERFWYHWHSSTNSRQNLTAFGRKLGEYCRGDKINRLRASRLAPWWKLS